MEKKSMGSFIAALRKSSGMTQQDVAEKLNVSNKTISKWECGDGYPEIMMIPAIAELFGVTSDEILKGERLKKETGAEDNKGSSEKQFKFLLRKSCMKFKNVSFAAMASVLLGLVLLFTVSYTFYRPTAGFGLMLIFAIAGCIIELIAYNNIHSSYESSGILDNESEESRKYLKMTYRYVSMIFSTAVFSFIIGLPFILVRSSIRDSVIAFGTYMTFFPFLVVISVIIIWIGRYLYRKNIAARYFDIVSKSEAVERKKLNKTYMIMIAGVLVVTAVANIYFLHSVGNSSETRNYGNEEAFNSFIEGMEQYNKDKQKAIENENVLIRPRDTKDNTVGIIIDSEKEYFFLVSEFENIKEIDHEKMSVTAMPDYNTIIMRENSIKQGFGIIYILEVFIVGMAYYWRRRKISLKSA